MMTHATVRRDSTKPPSKNHDHGPSESIASYSRMGIAIIAFAVVPAKATTYTISASTVNLGVIASSDTATGINCGSQCSAAWEAGSTVTLTATAHSSWTFAGWGGDDGCRTNKRTCRILVDGDKSVSAKFNPFFFASSSGTGVGVVNIVTSSATESCDGAENCSNGAIVKFSYSSGTHITLSTSAYPASTFVGFSGDCVGTDPCTVDLSTPTYVNAVFDADGVGPYELFVSIPNRGGDVYSDPPGLACGGGYGSCHYPFDAGITVTLYAIADTTYTFAGWSNAGCSGTDTCVVTMSSTTQGLGGAQSPAAWFYPTAVAP